MTFPQPVVATVTIGGTDVTGYIRPGTLSADDKLSNQINTIKMYLEKPPIVPTAWQEIIFLDGATKIFGGYVITPNDNDGADLSLDYNLSGSDYTVRLEKIKVKEEYENKTDAYIIDDLITKYLVGEGFDGSTYVTALKTHPRIRFNRVTILDVIKQLSGYAGADWSVDVDKKIHYYETETENAPFSVSDNPNLTTSFPYYGLKRNTDGSGVINRIEVIGGVYLSEDATFYLTGNGVDNRIIVPFRFHAPTTSATILVWRNDGTFAAPSWTALTVGAGYIDTLAGANEVLYYYNEKVIEQLNVFPNLANAVKITARYDVPLRVRVTDLVSYAFYNNMWFDETIVRSDITSKETAKMVAKVRLANKAYSTSAIDFSLNQPGLRSGQILRVVNSLRSIDQDFIIQTVKSTIGINGRLTSSVSVGTYNPDLIDLLMDLSKKANVAPPWRDDEVLDEILQTTESITFSEVTLTTESVDPYYFSEDPAEAFMWGFGTFSP